MYTCIVIDDEKLARTKIKELIKHDPNWTIIGEAAEFNEAFALINELKPDACFVDINIIGGSGVELVNQLQHLPTNFVFSTAYSEHAITAFELNATDYLLKPFTQQRFSQVLAKLETQTLRSEDIGLPIAPKSILAVRSIGSVQFIDVKDIIWIKGAANYVELHCQNKMLLHRETLGNLEAQLDTQKFVRVHRSAMVNIDKVHMLSSELGRLSLLQLTNGDEVKISTSHKTKLFERLGLEEH